MAINYDTAPSGGIDQQVQDKADTYRKNPEGLFGQYRASGDLIDLIALQRLNEERKAKQKEIAMQMEQKPQNVAQQEYEQAKGLIKDDIVGQTSKLLQEKQKRAATNQQRMMTGVPAAARRRPPTNMAGITGVPPRAPVNPRGTGIAANRVPSSPTAYGAGGGIVSFQNTGYVNPRTGRPFSKAAIEMLGYTQQEWANLDDAERGAVIEKFNAMNEAAGGAPLPLPAPVRGDFRDIRETDDISGNLPPSGFVSTDRHRYVPNERQLATTPINTSTEDLNPELEGFQEAPVRVRPEARTIDQNVVDEYDTAITDLGDAGTIAYQDPTKTPEGIELKDRQDLLFEQQSTILDQDSLKQRDAAAAWADKQTGKAGIADANTRMLQERKDMIAAGDRARVGSGLYDLLARAGGQGALANIGRAAADKRYQDLLRDERQLMGTQEAERYGLEQLRMAGETAAQAGTEAQKISSAERRNAATTMENILKQESDTLTDRAKMYLEQDRANMTETAALRRDVLMGGLRKADAKVKIAITELDTDIQREANRIKELAVNSRNLSTVTNAHIEAGHRIAAVRADFQELRAEAIETDPVILGLSDNIDMDDEEKMAQIRQREAAIEKTFYDGAKLAVQELEAAREELGIKMNDLMGQLQTSRTVDPTNYTIQTGGTP